MKAMDSGKLFEGIGYIRPELIEEAETPLAPKAAPILWLKKAGAAAASFLVIAAALFSFNAVFPAFAEELPLVGSLFRHLNSLGANAPTYDGLVRAVEGSGENSQYTVSAAEGYCDGEYAFFTLRLEAKDSKLLKMETLYTTESAEGSQAPGWDLKLDGRWPPYYDLPVFTRKGFYFESNRIKVRLPEKVDDGSIIRLEAFLGNLSGRTQESLEQNGEGQLLSIEPVRIRFQLTANTGYNQESGSCDVSVDELCLTGWSSSPSKFTVTLSYPYLGTAGVYAAARTQDGTSLGGDIRESGDLGDSSYEFGGMAIQTCSFAGPPEGSRSVIVTVAGEHPGQGVFGEFTIDLETGEASATANYREEGLPSLSIREYAEKAERDWNQASAIPGGSPSPSGR